MSNNEKDFMGYDPLEWLKEDNATAESAPALTDISETETTETASAVETSPTEAEPVDAAPATGSEIASRAETEASDDGVLEIASLQIMDVALLKPQWEETLSRLKEITLRADDDIATDGAGMQLLLAFVQQAERNGVRLQWEALPATIADAARLLNTEQVLLRN